VLGKGGTRRKGGAKMNRMVVKSKIGADGVLHVNVPVSLAYANRDVQVTIEPIGPPPMTQDDWRSFVLSSAGSIPDPSFERHDQGEYEVREELP
jgi:hypothetical protein